MKQKHFFSLVLICLATCLPATAQHSDTLHISKDTWLLRLTDFVYMYTCYKEVDGFGLVGANGLVVVIDRKALLVDAPWDEPRTAALCDYISDGLGAELQLAVVTHAHDDRIGGIAHLKRANIPVYASEATTMEAKKHDWPRPDIIFTDSLQLNFSGTEMLLFDPGKGHSADNIVVWIPVERLLFGGCFIKDSAATGPGNMADAWLQDWMVSLDRVAIRFTEAIIVVPGHGSPGGTELIGHTRELLKNYKP